MNRNFSKEIFDRSKDFYEIQRLREIIPYLDRSDILLDIHNTIGPSRPFLISEYGTEINNIIPVDVALTGLDELCP